MLITSNLEQISQPQSASLLLELMARREFDKDKATTGRSLGEPVDRTCYQSGHCRLTGIQNQQIEF